MRHNPDEPIPEAMQMLAEQEQECIAAAAKRCRRERLREFTLGPMSEREAVILLIDLADSTN